MKKIDESDLKLCKMQAEIFAQSLGKTQCSSPIFLRRFMYSQVAGRMDAGGFLFESCDINAVFEELNEEFGISTYGKEKFTESELYWMGYIYRFGAVFAKKQANRFIEF